MKFEIENNAKFSGALENCINTEIYNNSNIEKHELLKKLQNINGSTLNNRYKMGAGHNHVWISGQDNTRYAIVYF